jgi:putative chitinase
MNKQKINWNDPTTKITKIRRNDMNFLTASCDTLLKTHPVDSRHPNLPADFKSIEIKAGQKIGYNWIREEENHHLIEVNPPVNNRFNWYIFLPHFENNIASPVVRKNQVEEIFAKRITDYQFQELDKCLKRFEITTIPRVRHFLSQVAHESGGLQWMVELASGSAYEGRKDLGNIYPGDGRKYKGVDAIQLTGRANYQLFANFTNDPRVMEGWSYVSKTYLFLPSGFWWHRNNMNTLIDQRATVEMVSKRVNGGYNGLAERKRYYAKAVKII